jgi:bla regulator protein blaR1
MKGWKVDRRLFRRIALAIFQGAFSPTISSLAGASLAIASLAVASLASGGLAGAQVVQATGPLPSFEVATIKPNRGGPLPAFGAPMPNIFKLFNVTVRDLILIAYGLPAGSPLGTPSTRALGGPGWIDNNRYDVEGKIPDAMLAQIQKSPPQLRRQQTLLMVQSLLADRFKLAVHVETRVRPVYELVVAKGGPKLTAAREAQPGDNAPAPPATPGKPPNPADMRQGVLVHAKSKNEMEMTAKGQTLDSFAQMPFFGLDSPVVNKTGLTGKYDFTLDWARDQDGPPDAQVDAEAPGLFTAIEEQLGLKLVAAKGPVDVIVIDHIELPTEN